MLETKPLTQLVISNPNILSGMPVFAGTRVPVKNLLDYLEGGDNLDEFLDDFPTVEREHTLAVLESCRGILEAQAFSAPISD